MPSVKSRKSKKSVKSKGSRKVNAYIKWVNGPSGRSALLKKRPELKKDVPKLGKELGRIWRQKNGKSGGMSVSGGKRKVKRSKSRKSKSRR